MNVSRPGEVLAQDMTELGRFIKDVVAQNAEKHNFRIFGPDEARKQFIRTVTSKPLF